MKIYLIRHGETDWNVIGKLQGREDIPLNENGKMQAKICAQSLKNANCHAIITSPLQRAKQTAEIIANELSIETIYEEIGLVERDFGKASGLMPNERIVKFPDGKYDDMESWEDMRDRMMLALRKITEDFSGNDVIIVSHGSAINSVLAKISNYEIGSGKTTLKNTCINLIEYDGEKFDIIFFNKTADEMNC